MNCWHNAGKTATTILDRSDPRAPVPWPVLHSWVSWRLDGKRPFVNVSQPLDINKTEFTVIFVFTTQELLNNLFHEHLGTDAMRVR